MQYLLNDECGDCFRQFRPSFHDSQTERYDLSVQQLFDDLRIIDLNESSDNAQTHESQVFIALTLLDRVQKRVEEQWYVG